MEADIAKSVVIALIMAMVAPALVVQETVATNVYHVITAQETSVKIAIATTV